MSANNPPDSLIKWRFIAGSLLILFLIVLIVLLRYTTGGFIGGQMDGVLLLIGVALVTGIAFWTFTTSDGEFSVKELGIRLTGGAAIGASFMVLAWWLTKPNTTCVIVPLQATPNGQRFKIIEKMRTLNSPTGWSRQRPTPRRHRIQRRKRTRHLHNGVYCRQ